MQNTVFTERRYDAENSNFYISGKVVKLVKVGDKLLIKNNLTFTEVSPLSQPANFMPWESGETLGKFFEKLEICKYLLLLNLGKVLNGSFTTFTTFPPL